MTIAEQALTGLREAVSKPLDRNDLGGLAQMHSWCQNLIESAPVGLTPEQQQVVRDLANGLVVLLERLILDEAADADAGIQLIPEVVQALEQLHQGAPCVATPLLDRVCASAGVTLPIAAPPPAPDLSSTQPTPPATTAAEPADASPVEEYVSEPLIIDVAEADHINAFLEESLEHMDAIEAGLLEVESAPHDTGKLDALFRPLHTIKGIAGFLNLRDVNRLTHEMETILDQGRKGTMSINTGIVDLVFSGVDALKVQIDFIRQFMAAPTADPCPQPDIREIMTLLQRAARGEFTEAAPPTPEQQVHDQDTDQAVTPDDLDHTPADASGARPAPASDQTLADYSIRVDTAKLDLLVDTVGELVIAQSMVNLSRTVLTDHRLQRNVAQVSKIVRDVQETAMAMRMVPIGHTFQKMRRLVRDVARKSGRKVELAINGEDTELDKNVIQQISDPLMHMVRNAVDHGIEDSAARRQAGKPETGQVRLNAYHQGDSIVIAISDDGQGLDPRKLIEKGIERGLVKPDEELSDSQAFGLILQPGFSTASRITEISGRGVGMDVVKRNVEQLHGKIEITSDVGRGTTFHIRLPLTLAIIDGMIVGVHNERLIIPTILIDQSLRPEARHISTVQRRGEMLQVRGELCPVIQLGALFGYGDPIDPCENLVVLVQAEGHKIALVVDELIGQQQVVIKTLGSRFKQVQGVSGAAILGDGRVGLILEPAGLLERHNQVGSSFCSDRLRGQTRFTAAESCHADQTESATARMSDIANENQENQTGHVPPADNTDGMTEPAVPDAASSGLSGPSSAQT